MVLRTLAHATKKIRAACRIGAKVDAEIFHGKLPDVDGKIESDF